MDLSRQIMDILADANKAGTDDARMAYLHGHRDARHAAAELATEHAALLEEFRAEVQRCFDIAQALDAMNPTSPSAFTGTPSERIQRQLDAMAETL